MYMNKLNDSVKAVDLFVGTGSIQNLINSVSNTVVPSVNINKISGLSALQNYFNSSAYENISNIAQSCQEMISSMLDSMEDLLNSANQIMMNSLSSMKDFADNALLMTIADEIGFPIYMETNSELQDILIEIYQKNNYRCDKDKMTQIIIDYYDEKYIKAIYDDIEACGVFKPGRIKLIKEGLIVYHLGYYGASASEFILQISGMIHDVYDELKSLHYFTQKEKEGI